MLIEFGVWVEQWRCVEELRTPGVTACSLWTGRVPCGCTRHSVGPLGEGGGGAPKCTCGIYHWGATAQGQHDVAAVSDLSS
jgi:hypothetical protein